MTAFDSKLQRLRAWMAGEGFSTLVLGRLDNLAWLSCGADLRVALNTDLGSAWLVVTSEAVTAVTNAIEAPRLRDEALAHLDLPVREVPWHQGDPWAVIDGLRDRGGRQGSDVPQSDQELVQLAPLRYQLLADEVALYRRLGADLGAAVGEVARAVEPGETEFQAAGRLAAAMLDRGITPTVLLVAADERLRRYRHPLPTDQPIDRQVELVASGRRAGLMAAVTRLIHFGPLTEDLARRHEACCQVDATLIAHTRPGASVAAILASGIDAYRRHGFAEEWCLHHQGGAIGYQGRDYRATLDSTEVVQPWQAFAWNPSITGTKSEDTILAGPDGPEILTVSPDWPLRACDVAGRPLQRPDWLVR